MLRAGQDGLSRKGAIAAATMSATTLGALPLLTELDTNSAEAGPLSS